MRKRPHSRFFVFSLIVALASGCNFLSSAKFSSPAPETSQTVTAAGPSPETREFVAPGAGEPLLTTPETKPARQRIVEIGTSEFTAPAASQANNPVSSDDNGITLNFQGTNIREFISATLGDVLKLNYVIDPQVTGTVTIETAKPVSSAELFPLLEEVLAMNGAVIINTDGYYSILPKAKALKGNLSPAIATHDKAGGYSVRIIPLSHIAVLEMQKILEPFLPEGGSIRVDVQRNLLILGGTSQELERMQETIEIFDVDWLRGMSVGMYPLEYVAPEKLKSELDTILTASTEGAETASPLGGLVRTVAIDRLNSILLISSTPGALREAEIWIYRLDQPGEHAGQRLYVYEVQNAKAVDLANVLGHIFGTLEATALKPPAPSLAPGTTPVEITAAGDQEQQPAQPASLPIAVGDKEVSLASGSIKIIADDIRNALVVLASPEDYRMVEATIKKLDTVPLQVLIEASIIEVTLTNDLSYGVEWFFKNNMDGGNKTGRGTLDLDKAGIAALAPGFSYSIIDSAKNVRLAINALEEESDINVLSSPSLMVLDNQTAFINVGDSIPISTRSSISNIDPDAPTVNEIEYRETGVTLTVTPRVNNSGLVTMDIKQEVTDAIETNTSTLNSPTLQKREIESVVAVNSGETIVLGGLIRDSKEYSEGGIPLFYKLPILGKLFGLTNDDAERTELLVLITPRVVRNANEAKDITEEFRRKLKGIPPMENRLPDTAADKPS